MKVYVLKVVTGNQVTELQLVRKEMSLKKKVK